MEKLRGFDLVYLANGASLECGQRSWLHDIVAKIEPTRGGVFVRTNAVPVDSRHQKMPGTRASGGINE